MTYYYLMAKNWFDSEEGQDLIEYALVAGLIALAAVAAITLAGSSVSTIWGNIQTTLGTVPAGQS